MRNVENLNPGDSVDHFFLIHRATQGVTCILYTSDASDAL